MSHTVAPLREPRSLRLRALRLGALALALAVLPVGLAACSSSSPGSATTAGGGTSGRAGGAATVTIQDFSFHPSTIRVRPGAEVTVVNKDTVTHTLTSTTGAFATGDISGGKTVHFAAPSKSGSYPYRCSIHQYMAGTLVVGAS